eukprot:m.26525 g.26525  ORF g.26525 m.26525 type:complete len:322 (-) comp7805_c0_seq1:133-1098(-)
MTERAALCEQVYNRLYDLKWHSTIYPNEVKNWFKVLVQKLPMLTRQEMESILQRSEITTSSIVRFLQSKDAEIMENASVIVGYLSGQGVHSSLHSFGPLLNGQSFEINIREEAFAGQGERLGARVWPSADHLLRLCCIHESQFVGKRVLELGCGVGLNGIACAKMGCASVVLTDYEDSILQNTQRNVESNNVVNVASVSKLDWRSISHTESENSERVVPEKDFDIVIAADVIYDEWQASVLPKVIRNFLKPNGRQDVISNNENDGLNPTLEHSNTACFVVLGDRQARKGIPEFEKEMLSNGFSLVYQRHIGKETEYIYVVC